MEYQALYRRWRPRGFNDFVGQQHIVTTLSNAIRNKKIAHAYLFTGPRGTGKTSTAKIFAKALNCESPQGVEPCDQCSSCQRINEGTFLDVLEIDGASNRGIDEIRDLREKIKFTPAEGRYKIYIIDEIHMLTTEAFNALLKTLEEPPNFVVFILATTEVHKLPLTILSRCQRFDFKRFTIAEIKGRLATILTAEGIQFEDTALELIAKYAEGGMRDALSLLEQCIAHSKGGLLKEDDVRAILGLISEEEIEKLAVALKEHDTKLALELLEEVSLDGKDLFQFGHSLVDYFRDRLLKSLSQENSEAGFSPQELIRIIETIANATNEVKKSFQSSLPLELALIKLTSDIDIIIDNVSARLDKLEQEVQLLKGAAVVRPPAAVTVANPKEAAPKRTTASTNVKPEATTAEVQVKPSNSTGDFNWEAFLEMVKNRKRTVAALIQEGKLISFADGQLIVGFPPHLKFHLESLALPHNVELLETIIYEMVGSQVKLKCVPFQEDQTVVKQDEDPTPEIVKQAVSIFGGKVEIIPKEDK
ncbi:MAG TPA: DNA polymerase III subunit gamma/tau [Bacillota bacterium]|jgi:DNA polymerase-3 subunit gamma/tau|nr:DNA polymerase III subunit gamma/tau [Bacillota bacterium]HOL08611.1 DNA polymerase III subunit gamma/tau [Bacillota bacterium]HPO98406.1 DNA polymerase III subunit gamma/tau [Bacillota bacterium]